MYPWSSDLVMRFFSKQTFGQDSTPAQDGAVLMGLRVKIKIVEKIHCPKIHFAVEIFEMQQKINFVYAKYTQTDKRIEKRLDKSLRFISGATNNPLYATGSHSKWA